MWASGVGGGGGGSAGFDSKLRATLSGDQTIADDTWTLVDLDETDYDGLSELDAANSRIVLADDGWYAFNYSIALEDLGGGAEGYCHVFVNGTIVAGGTQVLGNLSVVDFRLNSTFDIQLSAGDLVTFKVFHTQGADRTLYHTQSGGTIVCMKRFA